MFYARTKYIDINIHFIRECIRLNKISISWIAREQNIIVDGLVKSLSAPSHKLFIEELGLKPI